MKNIAVVLRGHVRTWHFNAPKVFDFYDSIADNVDYYFTTWDTSNTDGIEGTFEDQNLIHFQILSHSIHLRMQFRQQQDERKGDWYNGQLGPPLYEHDNGSASSKKTRKTIRCKSMIVSLILDQMCYPLAQKISFGDESAGNRNFSVTKTRT